MTEILDLRDRLHLIGRLSDGSDLSFETFLLEEGLELLASYRSIDDENIRKAVKMFVRSLAKVDRDSSI